LTTYGWPGNIRELQNVIERSVIVCDSENLIVDESWLSSNPTEKYQPATLSRMPPAEEKRAIEEALAETQGRVSGPEGAATRLGIPPSTLDSKIKALGIRKNRFKTA
jgi:formate hydrogenlyase transcriptional activator